MAVLIEHDKRKKEILEKALDLFTEEGYEDVTFQKIADRCSITRTTLYIYFRNKREIFLWSIKQLLSGIEERILETAKNESLDAKQCLEQTLETIICDCEKNKRLFKVLLSYLIQFQKSGGNVRERVDHRIIKLKHFISIILIRGEKSGVFKHFSIKDVFDLMYSSIENGVFRLALYNLDNLNETRAAIHFIIESISIKG